VWKGYATVCRTHESPRYASNMEDHADIPAARKINGKTSRSREWRRFDSPPI
jgi:hypothetical protein